MEVEIRSTPCLRIIHSFYNTLKCACNGFNIIGKRTLASQADSMPLDSNANFHHIVDCISLLGEDKAEEISERSEIRLPHYSALPSLDFHGANRGQRTQGFANNWSAHPESTSEIALRKQPIARL
ncbi:hypothetical protein SAMN05518861_13015 [Mesorhizobium sp. YR577]|nr:hypothetical protein SAMN05518861_13015 [Mesorhizobium sp. YR577]